ncbi:MAG: peptidyl-tRNA hydrolase [Chloroflexi bacterium]|nr:peptidyl-tRNA hydrolase [Chloroflexota bacterium]
MKLVVGLGNAGPRYSHTRHNVGFSVIKTLGERHKVKGRSRGPAIFGEGKIADQDVVLAQPTTMMNLSGRAVAYLCRACNIHDLANMLVIVDDMDLPLGTVRFREGGSAGGHNGLKSIIEAVGTDGFSRLRIGVGRPFAGNDPVDHVLSTFRPDEKPIIDRAIRTAADAVESWIEHGATDTMNRFNVRGQPDA